jgi:ribose transport system substrate-binding protein
MQDERCVAAPLCTSTRARGAERMHGTMSRRGVGRKLGVALILGAVAAVALTASLASGAVKPPLKEQLKATQKECGSKTIKIAIVQPAGNSYGQAITQGIKSFLSPCKNVSTTLFDTGFDSQKEFNTFQNITAQKSFQGILFLPLDGVGVVPAVKDAISARIQVVNFNNPMGRDFTTTRVHIPGQAGTVIEPQYQRGIWMAQLAAQACAGITNCKIGFIAGVIGISAELAIGAGFNKELKKHPNMHLTTYQGGGQYLPDPSRSVAQNMLQAHPDLNVITGSGDQMIRGAQQAVEDAGKQKQVKLIGLGGSKIAVDAVKAGQWYGTVITQPLDQGRLSAKVVLDHIRNPRLKPQGINPFDYTHRSPLLTKKSLASSNFVPKWVG